MDGLWENPWLAAGLAALAGGYAGVQALLSALRKRRVHQHLGSAGVAKTARVVDVEPMQRELNHAAGHAVRIAIPHASGEHHVRDTTGLGGYLVRAGTELLVRQSPTDPDQVRVEQIVGPHGPYPVTPDGHSRPPSLVPALLLLASPVVIFVVTLALYQGMGINSGFILVPLLILVVGLVFTVVGLRAAAQQRRDRQQPQAEAIGVVTEVWTERVRSSSRRGTATHQPVYSFTVHFTSHDGREVHTRCALATSGFRPAPQQPVRVRYQHSHPPHFALPEQGGGAALVSYIMLIIGVITVLVGIVATAVVGVLVAAA